MSGTLLYDCIHLKLSEKVGLRRCLRKKDLYVYLSVYFHLPKKLIPCIIKEMEQNGIIKNLNKREVEVLPVEKDLMQQANGIYAKLGIF